MDPFPTARSVFARIAESTIDGTRTRKLLLSLLRLLGITAYAEQNRQKMISLAARGINPFDIDTVPKGFSGIYPEMSVSLLFEKSDDTVAQCAAKLVLAALKYRQSLLDGSLEKERSGEIVIDTSRNHNFFGRVANIRRIGPLKWSKDIRHHKETSHIVVAVNGAYYKVEVTDGNGETLAAGTILSSINKVIGAAQADSARAKPYGPLTTNITRWSERAFYADKLDESVRTIDDAIFLLAIDAGSPADENEAAQDLHIRNCHNRDYRKSLQIVVLGNGFSGAIINFFAGIEGVIAARFASWVSSYARSIPPIVAAEESSGDPVRLEFATIDFDKVPLQKVKDKIARYSCSLPLIKKIDVIGRNGIKRLGVSPDAFFHAAAHLAYYDRFKKIPSVHNFADIRALKFGSITRYRSTTPELVQFLRTPTKSALLDAFDAHRRTIAVIKSGDHPLHYAYYYLYAAAGLRPLLGMIVFKLFVPDIFEKHVAPEIGASNIPALSGIYCVGRFGTFFKAARRNCLAGHYLIFPDHIKTCFLASERGFLESWEFDRSLAEAMTKLAQILSRPHV